MTLCISLVTRERLPITRNGVGGTHTVVGKNVCEELVAERKVKRKITRLKCGGEWNVNVFWL